MSILTEKLNITIDGKNYDKQYSYSNIRLNQELMKPNELHFHMEKNTLIEDESDLQVNISGQLLGKEISFVLTTYRDDESKSGSRDTLRFSGIIFGVNALRRQMGDSLVLEVVAYSHDYLLQDSAHCNSYENSDLRTILSDVVSGCGNIPLSNNPVMGSDIPYTVQYNETSYQFLSRLARRYGEWFYNDGSQLVFGSLAKLERVHLVPGFDLLSYRYQMSMGHAKITHARHNYLDYQNTQAASSPSGGLNRLTNYATRASDEVYRKNTFRTYHSSTAEENGLDEVGHSTTVESHGKQGSMMTCRGRSNRCDLQIGSQIRIREYYDDGTGGEKEYSHEDLLVCGITHYIENDGSYENEFLSIASAVEYPPYAYSDLYPQASPQRAVVKDNKDPEQLGRVRVQFLWQEEQDDSLLTPWIRIAQPHGGDNKGFYFIPEIDEEVIVGFENGNAEKPYVTGTLYHGQAKPPGSWYNDEDNIKAIRTRSGHTIEFHDTEGEEYIKIYDNEKDNFILTFSTHEQLIKLESKGNIEMYADKNIIIDAKENITINAGINIDETAGENNTIKVGKDRTIEVVNNISEKAGDNNIIDIGKDRTITVGNNISETAGDNNTIDIGKDRTITVGNNISETAGDDITIDVGKNRTIKAGSNISETAGSNISIDAAKNISEKAGDSIDVNAAKSITETAGTDINISAGKDISQKAGKDLGVAADNNMNTSVGNTSLISVTENQTISIGGKKTESISDKYSLTANDILETATNKVVVQSRNHELKADNLIRLDGGKELDFIGNSVKIN